MEHGPQEKRQTLPNINFRTETMFSSLKFQKQKDRYSKDKCPLFPSQKNVSQWCIQLLTLFWAPFFYSKKIASRVYYSVAANRLSALFINLINYFKKSSCE